LKSARTDSLFSMRKRFLSLARSWHPALFSVLLLSSAGVAGAQQPVTLRFCNIEKAQGNLFLAIYNQEEGFMNEKKAFYTEVIPIEKKGCVEKKLTLPPGKYAISSFHDVNNNGRMDKTIVGIPKEPYGLSGSYTSKFSPPTWAETNVFIGAGQTLNIQLHDW